MAELSTRTLLYIIALTSEKTIVSTYTSLRHIPAYKAVLSNDVYLKYYKKFKKKDAKWHRKCKWMTVFFCIGSFFAMALGFFAMALIGTLNS